MDTLELENGSLVAVFNELRQELDEHLDVINENTDEIEGNFSYLINLEKRMKFLEQRLEKFEKTLSKVAPLEEQKREKKQIHITDNEQDVFLVIYNSPKAVDYAHVARTLRKSETYVRYQINGLISKGVPVMRHIINRRNYFSLDIEFKEMQCKENILNLSRTLTLDCFDQSII